MTEVALASSFVIAMAITPLHTQMAIGGMVAPAVAATLQLGCNRHPITSGQDRHWRQRVRARYPDVDGYIERDGIKVFYEVFGSGDTTLLLMPTWSIIHSRHWKMQVPYLSRHYRVVTFDGRGNGRSDHPAGSAPYAENEYANDALAVLDATQTERAIIVSLSMGAQRSLILVAEHPERALGAVFIAPSVTLAPRPPERAVTEEFENELGTDEGWAKYNRHYWLRDYPGFLKFFFDNVFSEPHSTKPIEDCVGWGLETTPETLIETQRALSLDPEQTLSLCGKVRCPVLVIQGTDDRITGPARGVELSRATGGQLVLLEGSGHAPHVRDPVKVNLLIREFTDRIAPARSERQHWVRGRARRKRALYISSPIGLGHARRDVAIADELRKLHPDLEIDWLAQQPVTRVLQDREERIHPASEALASEVTHIDSESAEHDLHCFQAWRRMDEILLANFMLFHDLVLNEDYDLWIGDEAWELDYYLHENPEQKRAPYVWLTDFVGWLPMPDGGEPEAFLTADYNAEMISHIARFPRVRDRAIFVGSPDDIVPDRFGRELPFIRDWTEEHYDFSGDYITGFDPADLSNREAIREELGYGPDEKVCVVTVGGSGVGEHLLRRIIDAYPQSKQAVPNLRMIVVAGPRIDPRSLPRHERLEVHGYVGDLFRHMAACDLAVVQGGLSTTMELTSLKRPFLYFPLRHHFEQNFHVRHRLERHGAGRRMDYGTATPEAIAEAIATEIGKPVTYRPIDPGAAGRVAAQIAELI
jgi:pimeloyl-ACP methyl ester carboxylesterase/predicted glycosyltransferase